MWPPYRHKVILVQRVRLSLGNYCTIDSLEITLPYTAQQPFWVVPWYHVKHMYAWRHNTTHAALVCLMMVRLSSEENCCSTVIIFLRERLNSKLCGMYMIILFPFPRCVDRQTQIIHRIIYLVFHNHAHLTTCWPLVLSQFKQLFTANPSPSPICDSGLTAI